MLIMSQRFRRDSRAAAHTTRTFALLLRRFIIDARIFILCLTTRPACRSSPCRCNLVGGQWFRFSDTAGASWSQRYRIPIRVTSIDRVRSPSLLLRRFFVARVLYSLSDNTTVAVGRVQGNPWNGTELQGWTVSKPIVHGNQTVLLPYTKVGTYLQGHDRNFVLVSDNILSERDPEKIVWRTWPAGDGGATQGCG